MAKSRKRGRGRPLPKLNHHLEDQHDRIIEKYFGSGPPTGSAQERRQAQYCRQAERLFQLLLCGEWTDPVLAGLDLLGVRLSAGAHQLTLELQLPAERAGEHPGEVEAQLQSAAGLLRAELAAHVKRKRTPALRFVVRPANAGGGEL